MTAASTPNNTAIWDKLARPDPKALSPFTRSGGFKGTAVNPMHTLHTVTEIFGPCGTGWGMTKPEFQVVNGNVYCTVGVWYEQDGAMEPIWGVGGETLTGRGDDEAFKKAYTDALGNALKHLGANADIYFKLWDGSKYKDEKPEPTPQQAEPEQPRPSEMPSVTGTPGASKAAFRDAYAEMERAIRNTASVRALKDLWKDNSADIDEWPPDFVDAIKIVFGDRRKELEKALAA